MNKSIHFIITHQISQVIWATNLVTPYMHKLITYDPHFLHWSQKSRSKGIGIKEINRLENKNLNKAIFWLNAQPLQIQHKEISHGKAYKIHVVIQHQISCKAEGKNPPKDWKEKKKKKGQEAVVKKVPLTSCSPAALKRYAA